MLSRVADAVYWMSRYIERAENVARFIEVNQAISLGGRIGSDDQWAPLIFASGDEEQFKELYGEFSRANVIRFLTFDRRNPNSILSCVTSARENARTIRDILSTAMWESVNRFYLRVREALPHERSVIASPSDFLERVKRSSHQVIGVTGVTFSHGEAWNFATLGRLLERADKTSRVLDVKYFILLPDSSHVGSTVDIVQWSALLESTSRCTCTARTTAASNRRMSSSSCCSIGTFPLGAVQPQRGRRVSARHHRPAAGNLRDSRGADARTTERPAQLLLRTGYPQRGAA
ncbi:MAG: alpha-E domain-containing protein [Planctomycetaceae bacterium]